MLAWEAVPQSKEHSMPGRFGGPRGDEFHAGFGLHWLFPLLFLGLLTAAVVVGILALMRTRHPATAGPPPTAPRPPDQALYELRLRYARGELSRDEYLQRAADLGDVRPPTPPMTPPAPPV